MLVRLTTALGPLVARRVGLVCKRHPFLLNACRQTGFTNFTLLAELNKPGAMYAYAATQALAPNITFAIGWPPTVEVRAT